MNSCSNLHHIAYMSCNNNRKHFVQVFVNKITGIGIHLYVQAMIMVEGFVCLTPSHHGMSLVQQASFLLCCWKVIKFVSYCRNNLDQEIYLTELLMTLFCTHDFLLVK
jgi:protein involved in ribonucleotide reduction